MKTMTKTLTAWIPMLLLLAVAAQPSFAQFGGGYGGSSRMGGGFTGGGRTGGFSGGGTSRSGSSSYSQSADGGRVPGTALIDYDNDTGSIIVYTDDETNEQIKTLVQSLDHPVPQVLIKVLFLEVTHSDNVDLGVEGTIKTGGKNPDTIQSLFGLANETRGGFYKIIDDDLEATIHAISENNKLEVLSRPSILTRNNQQAEIIVGQEVPFITNSQITNNGQTINTIQYSDVGIILNVTPHIAPEKMVEMQVEPEISTLTADTVPISETASSPVIAKRSASTRVFVGDGKTVVIGGMMENNNTDKITKIPVLGDIPYLGAIFRRTVKSKSKTELLIFLTPRVVENPNDLEHVTRREQDNGTLAPQTFTKGQMKQFLEDTSTDSPSTQQPSGAVSFKTEKVNSENRAGAAMAKRMGGVQVQVEDTTGNANGKVAVQAPPLGDQPEVLYEGQPGRQQVSFGGQKPALGSQQQSFRVRRRDEVKATADVINPANEAAPVANAVVKNAKVTESAPAAPAKDVKPVAAKVSVKGAKLLNAPAAPAKDVKPVAAKVSAKSANLGAKASAVPVKNTNPAVNLEEKAGTKTTVKGARLVGETAVAVPATATQAKK